MDWSGIEVVKILFRLLRVKGMGPARVNKLLFSIRNKVTTPLELQREVSVRLTEEQRLAFMQDYEIQIDYLVFSIYLYWMITTQNHYWMSWV